MVQLESNNEKRTHEVPQSHCLSDFRSTCNSRGHWFWLQTRQESEELPVSHCQWVTSSKSPGVYKMHSSAWKCLQMLANSYKFLQMSTNKPGETWEIEHFGNNLPIRLDGQLVFKAKIGKVFEDWVSRSNLLNFPVACVTFSDRTCTTCKLRYTPF